MSSPRFRMMPRFCLETLKTRALFKASAAGPRYSTPGFTMLRRPAGNEPDLTGLRFGFTVTKKIGGAVERNRIRRRLKAAVVAASTEFPQIAMDIVILARREAMTLGFTVLSSDIARAVSALARKDGTRSRPGRLESPSVETKTADL